MRDTCAFTCYPNGIVVLIVSQIILLAATILSAGSMLDCKFVIADLDIEPFPPSSLLGLVGEERRGLGFFIHEESNGKCRWEYWENEDTNEDEIRDYIRDYIDWLGDGWETPRAIGSTALALGVVMLLWALFFACVAHPKPLRYIFTAICVLFVMTFQFGTLAVMNSGFCDERNCKLGRSARYAIAAGVLYFVGGGMFIFTNNFPGKETEQDEQIKEVLALQVDDIEENGTHTGNDEEEPPVFETIEDFDDTDGISGAREVKPEAAVVY